MFKPDIFQTIKAELKNLTNIPYLALTKRGNHAIELALTAAKKSGKTKCVMFDQGGWITYPQFAKELEFEEVVVKTKDCVIDMDELEKVLDKTSVLIMHSLSGYFVPQPMEKIYKLCLAKGAMLINDCCGSVSEPSLLYGDIFVCSFGRWKPLYHGTGGFIGTRNSPMFYQNLKFDEAVAIATIKDPAHLLSRIEQVKERVTMLNEKSLDIIKNLKKAKIEVLNKELALNLVVIALYNDDESKKKILQLCEKEKLETTQCPRDIRVLREALSIEVKRIE